jgi:hypothetical protein
MVGGLLLVLGCRDAQMDRGPGCDTLLTLQMACVGGRGRGVEVES